MEQNVDMSVSVMGNEVAMKVQQTMDYTWHIKSVSADGKASLTQITDRVRFKMEGPMVNIDYDSKTGKEPTDAIGKAVTGVLSGMVGAEFQMTMDARGQISDLKIPDKVKDAVKKLPGGGLGLDFASEDGFKKMMSQEHFALAWPEPQPGLQLESLFTGLDGQPPSSR